MVFLLVRPAAVQADPTERQVKMARPKPIKKAQKAARKNPQKDVRYFYPDHPFIVGYSIPEDEIVPAVEKLNRAFNQPDNYQRPQWMWISGPLDDSQICLLEQFVGQSWQEKESSMSDVFMLVYQHKTKERFLGLLKSKLRRCCNIQNPDTLTWDEIFAAIHEYMSDKRKGKETNAGEQEKAKPEGERSKPMSKSKMMAALKIDSYKTFNAWARDKAIKPEGNRQTFTIRLDLLDPKTRQKLERT